MKQLINGIFEKLGWQLVRYKGDRAPVCDLYSFFTLLKSLGFEPRHIIDVGANHGTWTRTALGFFPDAHYTLIEPQDGLKREIQDLINQGYKLHWINAGAGDKPGELLFTLSSRDDSSSFVPTSAHALESSRAQVPVAVRTLNEIVASTNRPAPEMIKIDAEGFDLKVLSGASAFFGKTEIFLIEACVCSPIYENTILDVINRMAEAGYKLMDITDFNRSERHRVLWLCELAFIRNDSPLLNGIVSY